MSEITRGCFTLLQISNALRLAVLVCLTHISLVQGAYAGFSSTQIKQVAHILEGYAETNRIPVPKFADRTKPKLEPELVRDYAESGIVPIPTFADRTKPKLEPELVRNYAGTDKVPLPKFADRSNVPGSSDSLVVAGYEARPIPTFADRRQPAVEPNLVRDFAENGTIPLPKFAKRKKKETKQPHFQLANAVSKPNGKAAGCLAAAIYFEARSEVLRGRVAVAQVILNRVKSKAYPDTICDVVYQNAHRKHKCQFSFACDGKPDNPANASAWASAVSLANQILYEPKNAGERKGNTPLQLLPASMHRVTHYHANYVSPSWGKVLEFAGNVGVHRFYVSERVWSKTA